MLRFFGRLARALALPVLALTIAGFFAWHTIHGARGLDAQARRREEIAAARLLLARVEAERDALERRVAGFRGGQIDADQLDERARSLLGFVGRDEIVVPIPPHE